MILSFDNFCNQLIVSKKRRWQYLLRRATRSYHNNKTQNYKSFLSFFLKARQTQVMITPIAQKANSPQMGAVIHHQDQLMTLLSLSPKNKRNKSVRMLIPLDDF